MRYLAILLLLCSCQTVVTKSDLTYLADKMIEERNKDAVEAPAEVLERPSEPTTAVPSILATQDEFDLSKVKEYTAQAGWIQDAIVKSRNVPVTFKVWFEGGMFHHDFDIMRCFPKNGSYPDKVVFFGVDGEGNVIGYSDTAFSSSNPLKVEHTEERPADMSRVKYFWAVFVNGHVNPVERSVVKAK